MTEIRKAADADIEKITKLRMDMLREVASELPESLEDGIRQYLQKHIPNGSCICFLMEDDGEIIAKAMLCCYEVLPDEDIVTGKAAALYSVYTIPKYRGKGYMQQLLSKLISYAKEEGISVIHASAEEAAIPLYSRLGFQIMDCEMILSLQ